MAETVMRVNYMTKMCRLRPGKGQVEVIPLVKPGFAENIFVTFTPERKMEITTSLLLM